MRKGTISNVLGLGTLFAIIIGAIAFYDVYNFNSTPDVPSKPVAPPHIAKATFGCQDKKFVERFQRILGEGDTETAMDMIKTGLSNGECTELNVGETVYIEDTVFFDELYKVRPKGSDLSYWTSTKAVHL